MSGTDMLTERLQWELSECLGSSQIDFSDFTFAATRTTIWSVLEMGTTIVVSSPMIQPIFHKTFHSISSPFRRSKNDPYDQVHTRGSIKGTGFGRLTDELPLTHMEPQDGVAHRAQAIANPAGSDNSLDECHAYTQATSRGDGKTKNKIHVKVDTTIQRSEMNLDEIALKHLVTIPRLLSWDRTEQNRPSFELLNPSE